MIRIILNHDRENTTITAAAVDYKNGELLAASVLQYKEEAEGLGDGLQHLAQYGNYIHPQAPDLLHSQWGDIIHKLFANKSVELKVEASTPWQSISLTPSFTANEVFEIDDLISQL